MDGSVLGQCAANLLDGVLINNFCHVFFSLEVTPFSWTGLVNVVRCMHVL
jgi:hypothetical protein